MGIISAAPGSDSDVCHPYRCVYTDIANNASINLLRAFSCRHRIAVFWSRFTQGVRACVRRGEGVILLLLLTSRGERGYSQ